MSIFISGDSFNILSNFLMYFYDDNRRRYSRLVFKFVLFYIELLTLIAIVRVNMFGSREEQSLNALMSSIQQLVSIKDFELQPRFHVFSKNLVILTKISKQKLEVFKFMFKHLFEYSST